MAEITFPRVVKWPPLNLVGLELTNSEWDVLHFRQPEHSRTLQYDRTNGTLTGIIFKSGIDLRELPQDLSLPPDDALVVLFNAKGFKPEIASDPLAEEATRNSSSVVIPFRRRRPRFGIGEESDGDPTQVE